MNSPTTRASTPSLLALLIFSAALAAADNPVPPADSDHIEWQDTHHIEDDGAGGKIPASGFGADSYHRITLLAEAYHSYHTQHLGTQTTAWEGTHLAQLKKNEFRTEQNGFRVYFNTHARRGGSGRDGDGLLYLDGEDLRTSWRAPGAGRHDLDWTSLRLGAVSGNLGIHTWLIPVAGVSHALDISFAWDHVALRSPGGQYRTRDGVRANLGLFHVDGALWSDDGPSIGIKLDCSVGAGSLSNQGYGVFSTDFQPYLGFCFRRSAPRGVTLPCGGIYLGANFGSRYLGTFGSHPTHIQAAWAFQPTLTAVVYF